MRFHGIKCDVCEVQKQCLNHWFLIDVSALGITVTTWNDSASDERYEHICGESCLQKRISQWAETRVRA